MIDLTQLLNAVNDIKVLALFARKYMGDEKLAEELEDIARDWPSLSIGQLEELFEAMNKVREKADELYYVKKQFTAYEHSLYVDPVIKLRRIIEGVFKHGLSTGAKTYGEYSALAKAANRANNIWTIGEPAITELKEATGVKVFRVELMGNPGRYLIVKGSCYGSECSTEYLIPKMHRVAGLLGYRIISWGLRIEPDGSFSFVSEVVGTDSSIARRLVNKTKEYLRRRYYENDVE